MNTTQQPEALRLAHLLELDKWPDAASELRRLHAENQELKEQMAAIGAGGMESLRKRAAQAAVPETREALAKRLIADVQVANAIAAVACQRVAELPDRDSPADWPEAMLVTGDELHMIVREVVIEAQSAPTHPAEGVPATDDLLFQCGKAAGRQEVLDEQTGPDFWEWVRRAYRNPESTSFTVHNMAVAYRAGLAAQAQGGAA